MSVSPRPDTDTPADTPRKAAVRDLVCRAQELLEQANAINKETGADPRHLWMASRCEIVTPWDPEGITYQEWHRIGVYAS